MEPGCGWDGEWMSLRSGFRLRGRGGGGGEEWKAGGDRGGVVHSRIGNEALLTILVVLLASISFLPGTMAVNCYHGLMTVAKKHELITDKAYWKATTGSSVAANVEICQTAVSELHNTCSLFCKTYEALTSGEKMYECRRFCETSAGCNASFAFQQEKCDAELLRPNNNRVLTGCILKCSQKDNSNFFAECRIATEGGKCVTVGRSSAHLSTRAGVACAVLAIAATAWNALV